MNSGSHEPQGIQNINRRLIRGRDSSASEGKYISSIAPYGYKRVKLENEKGFTLEPIPEEAEVVKARVQHVSASCRY